MENIEATPELDNRVTYLLSSIYGFGHSSRASAIADLIQHNFGIDFFVKNPNAKDYLLNNLSDQIDATFESADYEKEMTDSEYLAKNFDALMPLANKSKFLLSDFLMQSKSLSFLSSVAESRPKTIGIYHSLTGYETIDPEVELFKTTFLDIASMLDVVFLAELNTQYSRTDVYRMDSGTFVIPTGPVVRRVTKSPEEIKKDIGLAEDDKFIYVQGGGLTNGERLDSVVKSLSGYSIQGMKLVINDKEGKGTSDKDIFYINPRPDGHNIVNASSGVISKPGMGIVSETIATRTPLFLIDYPTPESRAKYDMLAPLVGDLRHRYDIDQELTPQIREWIISWDQMRSAFGEVACNGTETVAEYLNNA